MLIIFITTILEHHNLQIFILPHFNTFWKDLQCIFIQKSNFGESNEKLISQSLQIGKLAQYDTVKSTHLGAFFMREFWLLPKTECESKRWSYRRLRHAVFLHGKGSFAPFCLNHLPIRTSPRQATTNCPQSFVQYRH